MTTRIFALLLLCSTAFAQDTAMFRGDPQHSGIYDTAGVPAFHQVKWKFHTNGKIYSSPAVTADAVYVGSTDGFLYAVGKDGAEKWKFQTRGRVSSSPAVSAGLVYFGSYDGYFYAVDAATGRQKWRFQTDGERRFTAPHIHGLQPRGESMPDPFDFFLSSPVVWSGGVYFGSGDGNIYALDALTGVLKWKVKAADVVHASPAIADGILYVGSWDTIFYALEAATGKEMWRHKTGYDPQIFNQIGIQSSAVVADGVVYFGCRDSNLYALDAKTGEKKWIYNNKGSWVIGSPAVYQGKVYFTTSDGGMFHVLDAGTGADVYSQKLIWPMFSSPAIAGDTLYIGSHSGKLLAFDLKSRKQTWVYETDAAREFGPRFTNPDGTPNYTAAFTDGFYDAIIIGVDRMFAMGAFLSSPVPDKGVIYVGSTDGNLYALE